MIEEGFVKSVNGDTCEVLVKRKTACGENCAACKGGCTAKEQICIAKNKIGAKIGDKVLIELSGDKVLFSAFLVYILPILLFFLVFGAASRMGFGEAVGAAGGIIAMAAVFLVLKLKDKESRTKYLPEITEII